MPLDNMHWFSALIESTYSRTGVQWMYCRSYGAKTDGSALVRIWGGSGRIYGAEINSIMQPNTLRNTTTTAVLVVSPLIFFSVSLMF